MTDTSPYRKGATPKPPPVIGKAQHKVVLEQPMPRPQPKPGHDPRGGAHGSTTLSDTGSSQQQQR
jgi:hypothetical protein